MYKEQYCESDSWILAHKTEDKWICIKSGSEDYVKDHKCNLTNMYNEIGCCEEIDNIYLFDSKDFGENAIQKCLDLNSNYIEDLIYSNMFLEKIKLNYYGK